MAGGLYNTLPILASAGFAVAGIYVALRKADEPPRGAWIAPALLAVLFFCWSAVATCKEGLLGFWPEHVRDAWSNQIWFDLLLGIGTAFALLAARARSVGMHPFRWLIAIACTGSIGLLAMTARYLFLKERAQRTAGALPGRSAGAAAEGLG